MCSLCMKTYSVFIQSLFFNLLFAFFCSAQAISSCSSCSKRHFSSLSIFFCCSLSSCKLNLSCFYQYLLSFLSTGVYFCSSYVSHSSSALCFYLSNSLSIFAFLHSSAFAISLKLYDQLLMFNPEPE